MAARALRHNLCAGMRVSGIRIKVLMGLDRRSKFILPVLCLLSQGVKAAAVTHEALFGLHGLSGLSIMSTAAAAASVMMEDVLMML